MPKKSTAARSAAQRNKPRVQKSFELVRPTSSEKQETVANTSTERASASVATTPAEAATTTTPVATVETSSVRKEQESKESTVSTTSVSTSTASKGSAAARLAARRQAAQKTPQRSSAALITPEHYAYVRRDLIFIAILAAIMFSAIIILHFVPGIGS
jgi:hypothetical protein